MMKKQALYIVEKPISKGIEGNHVGMYRENEISNEKCLSVPKMVTTILHKQHI